MVCLRCSRQKILQAFSFVKNNRNCSSQGCMDSERQKCTLLSAEMDYGMWTTMSRLCKVQMNKVREEKGFTGIADKKEVNPLAGWPCTKMD